jgi:hypothetical protein
MSEIKVCPKCKCMFNSKDNLVGARFQYCENCRKPHKIKVKKYLNCLNCGKELPKYTTTFTKSFPYCDENCLRLFEIKTYRRRFTNFKPKDMILEIRD